MKFKINSMIGDSIAAYLSAGLIALLLIAMLLANVLPVDPRAITDNILSAPSSLNWLGTDDLGRDVLSNIIYGTRVSMTVGITASLAAGIIGILAGGFAGFYGGVYDATLMRISEILQVMPKFVLAAFIIALSGPGLSRIIIVITLLSWPQAARIMRGEVMRIRQAEYIDAARCLRYSELKILFHEVIPNAVSPTLAVCTLVVAQAILLEAALSFFGLGNPDTPSWGRLLNAGQQHLSEAWWLSAFPGLAIFMTVLAFNILGDAISRTLNPKEAA